MEDLPPDEIRSYAAQSGTVYWYYDPDICVCVYEGHQNEFDRYQMALRQESDTAQYAAESDDQQVASLNALNGAFFLRRSSGSADTPPAPSCWPPRIRSIHRRLSHALGAWPVAGRHPIERTTVLERSREARRAGSARIARERRHAGEMRRPPRCAGDKNARGGLKLIWVVQAAGFDRGKWQRGQETHDWRAALGAKAATDLAAAVARHFVVLQLSLISLNASLGTSTTGANAPPVERWQSRQ